MHDNLSLPGFDHNSRLPYLQFRDGGELLKSGHYSIDDLTTVDSSGTSSLQRFYKAHPKGKVLVYDPERPFGNYFYELI